MKTHQVVMASTLCAAAAAAPASAQTGRFAELPESYEIELARSAAPAWFSDSATIYVFRGGRHVVAREGTRGACGVFRDHPESLAPICFDEEATRTALKYEMLLHRLRHTGHDEEAVNDSVARAIGAGEIPLPRRPAFTYMMSRDQILYTGADGRRVGPWQPHVMIYYPSVTGEDLGFPPNASGGFQVAEPGTPMSYFVIAVPDWSRQAPVAAPGRGGSSPLASRQARSMEGVAKNASN